MVKDITYLLMALLSSIIRPNLTTSIYPYHIFLKNITISNTIKTNLKLY
jgi:hypothetical protein